MSISVSSRQFEPATALGRARLCIIIWLVRETACSKDGCSICHCEHCTFVGCRSVLRPIGDRASSAVIASRDRASNSYASRRREDLVDDIAGVPQADRHKQHDFRLLVGNRTMLHPPWDDDKITRIEFCGAVTELKSEMTAPTEEHFVSIGVMMPRKRALFLLI